MQHVAAPGLQRRIDNRHHRVARLGLRGRTPGARQPDDPRRCGGMRRSDAIADPHPAMRDRAGKAAKAVRRAAHPLDRQAQGPPGRLPRRPVDPFQRRKQGRPLPPGGVRPGGEEIVAVTGADRQRRYARKAEPPGQPDEGRANRREAGGGVFDEIDLVDRQDDGGRAHQRGDDGVPESLFDQSGANVDEQQRAIGARGGGGHVGGVLRMPRGVGEQDQPPRSGQTTMGDVDRHPLRALVLQPVDQKGRVGRVAHAAEPRGQPRDVGKLVLARRPAGDQQTPEQGRLAVIDRAADDDAQGRPGLFLRRPDQKYPSRFFLSMESPSSWSISRPARSERRAAASSAITASTVCACDRKAPVSG
jgi:hypothetical protein